MVCCTEGPVSMTRDCFDCLSLGAVRAGRGGAVSTDEEETYCCCHTDKPVTSLLWEATYEMIDGKTANLRGAWLSEIMSQ